MFREEILGRDAVESDLIPAVAVDSLRTNVYMDDAWDESRLRTLGRRICSLAVEGLTVDIFRSPVIGLMSITSCAAWLSMLDRTLR